MIGKSLLIMNVLLLLFIWVYPTFYYADLPDIIPVHFDGKGNPEGFGGKNMIWVEAGIATVLFGICYFIYLRPNMINLPDDMKQNKQATRNFSQILCLVTMLIFAFLMYQGIQTSLRGNSGFTFPPGLVIGFLYLSIIGMLVYLTKANEKKVQN